MPKLKAPKHASAVWIAGVEYRANGHGVAEIADEHAVAAAASGWTPVPAAVPATKAEKPAK